MQFTLEKLLEFGLAMVLTSADAIAQMPNLTRQQQGDRATPMNFQGRYLVSISDAEMLASAYVEGQLGSREGRDALSVIPLGGQVPVTRGTHSMVVVP